MSGVALALIGRVQAAAQAWRSPPAGPNGAHGAWPGTHRLAPAASQGRPA
jgi:hypothetical protein